MKIDIGSVLGQIQQAKQRWESILPHPNVANNALAPEISNAFEQIEALLGKLPNELEVDGLPWQIAMQQLTAIVQHSGNPAQIQGMASWLWTFNNALLDAVPLKYVSKEKGVRVTKRLEEKINLLESHLDAAQKAKEYIESVANQWDKLEERIQTLSESFDASKAEIDELKEAANEAANEAKSSSASAKEQLEEMTQLLQGIEEATEKQQALFKEFEEHRDEIARLLEGASQAGLAASFQARRKELDKRRKTWAMAFIGSISLLMLNSSFLVFSVTDNIYSIQTAVHLFLTAPLVWLAWFSARQYGYALRISEDYAFKEAAAMSFVGYRNEMATDEEMLQLLREYAIRNFGKNPADTLVTSTDHSTPLHEALDKFLSKMKPDELFDMLFRRGGEGS